MRSTALVFLALALAACGSDDGMGPPPSGTVNLELGAGEVRVLRSPDIHEVTVEGSAGTYVFIPSNANAIPDVVETYDLGFTVGTAAATASLQLDARASADLQSETSGRTFGDLAPTILHHRFEQRLRAFERKRLDLRAAQRSLRATPDRVASAAPSALTPSRSAAAVVAAETVGEVKQIRVPDGDGNDLCEDFVTITATVKAVGTHSVILQDNAAPANGFTDADFTQIAAEFDNLIFPTATRYFGNPSDRDVNAKILILYTPEVNKLTPPNSTGFVGGFFFSGDLFPRTDPDPDAACNQSNVAEIFYLLVPDPTGSINNNQRTAVSVRQGTRGTIAHELQHMINAGRRLTEGVAQAFEAVWLDEALAHMSEDFVGRALFGFAEFQNLTFQDVTSRGANDFNAFFFQNLARFRFWQQRPDTAAATSSRTGEHLAYRGAAWALVRYTADQYSGNDLPNFTRRVVGGPDTSVANLTQKAGVVFDSLMAGWMVANFADDLPVGGLNAKYTYRSWNFRSASAGITNNNFPLRVVELGNTLTQSQPLRSGTGVYFRKAPAGGNSVFTFTMRRSNGSQLTAPGARLYVVRTN
ncbi:MAG TPA: hypothetical protein VJ812_03455 [Gemmatimonadaceae bacterium]|jgi:hypothetical protein|nr:hypothetical protein [Gemmatimonadaceae bacterium]